MAVRTCDVPMGKARIRDPKTTPRCARGPNERVDTVARDRGAHRHPEGPPPQGDAGLTRAAVAAALLVAAAAAAVAIGLARA